jgi:protein SCO1/2
MREVRSQESGVRSQKKGVCRVVWAAFCLLLCACFFPALAQLGQNTMNGPLYGPRPELGASSSGLPVALREVGIDQRLNEQLPLDAQFRDETGREVQLKEYFQSRPVIFVLAYYDCPMLCTQILNGVVSTLRVLPFDAGKEFDVVVVSFDPRETPQLAASKKDVYMQVYKREGAARGWHFLTGQPESIKRVTEAVGFRYYWDEATKQFAHASGIMVATPEGKLSHYFYGVEYAPKDVRLSLVEASQNRIGSPVDQLMLYCYHYDPATGKYGMAIMSVVRLAGAVTVLGILALLIFLRRPRGRRRAQVELNAGGAA